MLRPVGKFTLITIALAAFSTTALAQSNLTAKANVLQPAPAIAVESDRVRDGLLGPVRRVRTEVAKLSNQDGRMLEGKHAILEVVAYDIKGNKIENQYFPIAGANLTGKEVYKYDDKGNISEMTMLKADGSLLSKEVYKYEFDSIGNWVKMTTSVAVVANQKIEFEPTEVTYRTIFYYLDAWMAKMLQPATNTAANGKSEQAKAVDAASSTEMRTAASLPVRTSFDKTRFSDIQPPTANISAVAVDSKNNSMPNEAPLPRILRPLSGGVLNGRALSLPVPTYPEIARRARTAGKVEVDVVVDETGKVISAQAVSGPPSLRDAAVEAAKRARFSPTKLSGAAVKISGSINYNFSLP